MWFLGDRIQQGGAGETGTRFMACGGGDRGGVPLGLFVFLFVYGAVYATHKEIWSSQNVLVTLLAKSCCVLCFNCLGSECAHDPTLVICPRYLASMHAQLLNMFPCALPNP